MGWVRDIGTILLFQQLHLILVILNLILDMLIKVLMLIVMEIYSMGMLTNGAH